MSWIQWQGEQWETTTQEAELRLHLWQPQAMCPRISWSLTLDHSEPSHTPNEKKPERWLDLELPQLHFHERDWRKLAGLEIRADAAWHARHEYCHDYGSLVESTVNVHTVHFRHTSHHPGPGGKRQNWRGLDYILRLGPRDGYGFSCELDAWLMPESEYWRTTPQPPGPHPLTAQGPPQLRVVTRAVFTGGSVNVPRAQDPLPHARRYLRELASLHEMHDPHIQWDCRFTLDGKGTEELPGGISTVHFRTRPPA